MLNLTKLALVGSVFAVFASSVFAAAEGNHTVGAHAKLKPSALCDSGACFFKDLEDYRGGAGQAANYYCMPSESVRSFKMENHGAAISGFQGGGKLDGDVDFLRTHSFAVYSDPDSNAVFSWVGVLDQNGKSITCAEGRGDPVRPLAQGAPK